MGKTKCIIGRVHRRPKFPKWERDYYMQVDSEEGEGMVPILIPSTMRLDEEIQKGTRVLAECILHEVQTLNGSIEQRLGALVKIEVLDLPEKKKVAKEKLEKKEKLKQQILDELRKKDIPELEQRIRDYIRSLMTSLKR